MAKSDGIVSTYWLQFDQAEPTGFTTRESDGDTDPGWEAVCTRMVDALGEWLDAAKDDSTIPHDKSCEISALYAQFDMPYGADGVTLPYTLTLPEAGILPEQRVRIWETFGSNQVAQAAHERELMAQCQEAVGETPKPWEVQVTLSKTGAIRTVVILRHGQPLKNPPTRQWTDRHSLVDVLIWANNVTRCDAALSARHLTIVA